MKVRMNSTGLNKKGKPTGYFKTTTKRTKAAAGEKQIGKLEMKMYDPRAWNEKTDKFGMHVLFKEGKISKGSKGNK